MRSSRLLCTAPCRLVAPLPVADVARVRDVQGPMATVAEFES